jgi:signal transduction histidine kinase/ActR/RegA family two-component response regulator
MGEMVRSTDWSGTPLGPIDGWPQCLRTAVGLVLDAPVAAAVAWGAGHVLIYNDHYRAMCQDCHPQALGQSFRVCWAAPAATAVMDAFERALSGQVARVEDQRRVLDRQGRREEVRATFSFTPIRDESGQVGGVLHWITEDTQPEQTRLRAAVERERGRLLSVLEDMPLTSSITRGPDHRLVFANAMLRRMVGGRDVVGVTMRAVLGERGQASLAVRDRVYATGETAVLREVSRTVVDRGDGNPGETQDLYFDVFYQPDLGPDGQVQGVISFGFDVTEQVTVRRQLQEALRATQDALEQRARAEVSLRDMDRRKDEFLAMLAHELRNPLSPIVTALQLMRLRGGAGGAFERERQIIERQAANLMRLVDDLLDVSRVAQGKIALELQAMELAVAVARAVELASPVIQARNHRLAVDVPASGLCVHGDEHRLVQVVSNLLTNAAKYTDPGGVIEVGAGRAGGEVALSVRDTGSGIAPELLPRIFELFVQADGVSGQSQGGLGLGLAIVHRLVTMHGGTIEARSDGPGRGSEFVVRLPLLDAAAAGQAGPQPGGASAEIPDERPRVLVVDDNEDAADMIAAALGALGYPVDVAYDGQGALDLAQRGAPSIAILDIGLPDMEGHELARRLRARLGSILLIAVTGYGQQRDRELSQEAGFVEHLIKPIDIEVLVRKLEDHHSGGRR